MQIVRFLKKIPLIFWEVVPLVIFLLGYRICDLYVAILALMLSSGVAIAMKIILKLPMNIVTIVGYGMLILMGSLSILADDVEVFKMKPTVVNLAFALLLWLDFMGIFKQKQITKIIPMLCKYSSSTIRFLSIIWMIYFCCCAVINEIIWRNFSEEIWIYYKIIGGIGLNIAMFIVSAMMLQQRRS
jgi:intracellular septation protein